MALTNDQNTALAIGTAGTSVPAQLLTGAWGGNKHHTPVGSGTPGIDQLNSMFQGTDYASSPELQNILQKYTQSTSAAPNTYLQSGQWANDVKSTIDQYANTFSSMFQNQVGRPPTADEYNTFFKQVVTPDQPWATPADRTLAGQQTKGLLSDVFSSTAQQEATKKLQQQATAAVAPGSAFDQWQQSYLGNVNSTTQALQDYQTRLFQKIQPQLLTSLQSQGLLNTGGLNEALAGVQGDLANTGSMYAAQMQGQAAQDIANQKYAIQSNPTNYQMNATAGNPANMLSQGQNALQNVWNNYLQGNQNAFAQNMYNQQQANQPSLLQQYGGMILGGMAGGAGQALGTKLVTSDRRLKEDIVDKDSSLDSVLNMNVVRYKYKNSNGNHIGLIAQELKEIVPEAVKEVNGYLHIDYNEVIPILIQSIQELTRKLEVSRG